MLAVLVEKRLKNDLQMEKVGEEVRGGLMEGKKELVRKGGSKGRRGGKEYVM